MWSAEIEYTDAFGHPFEVDPQCEFCDRSLVTRFGGMAYAECEACRDEFRRLSDAGKVWEVEAA